MKLGTRLAAGFGALLFLLLCLVGMSAWQMRSLAGETTDYTQKIVPSLEQQNIIGVALGSIRRAQMRHLLSDTAAEMEGFEAEMEKDRQKLLAALDLYERTFVANAEDRRHLDMTRKAFDAYWAGWPKMREASRRTGSDPAALHEAKQALAAGLADYRALQQAIDDWWKDNIELSNQAGADAQATYGQAKLSMGVLAALALLVGVAVAVALTRSVLRQIGGEPDYAKQVVAEIAQGNLAVPVELRDGDRDSLLAAMKTMRDRLCDVVTQVRHSSDSIATGSVQIATGNADLSQRTEAQASNLQQTAASMEQLSSTVQVNADTTQQASALASQAAAAAAHGGQTVGAAVATMHEVATSSRRIADIIGVIDGIAFQTNILALNAAVEAARAGEQGRGFAVVASEVRSLAGRSAEAAREIKSLISASVEKVEVGERQVNEAGASMEEIVAQVQRVNQLISEIASATNEQSSGIGQIGQAVTQLDEVTQQNAALVEESAAAADSLRQQAARLADVVGMFRIEAGSGAAQPTAPRTPALPSAPAPQPTRPAQPPRAGARATRAPAPGIAAAGLRTPSAATAAAADDDWTSF